MNLAKLATPLLIAAILGGIEMRVAVGRLETKANDLESRIDRIERHLDGTAMNDHGVP